MLRPEINWETCQACFPCLARQVCKTRAIIKIDPDEPPIVEIARCNGCGVCVLACSCGAIVMKNSSVSGGNPDGCLPFR